MAVVWSPVRTPREVAGGHSVLPGFVVVSVYAASGLVVSTILVLSGATRRQLEQGFEQSGQPTLPPEVLESLGWVPEIGIPIIAVLLPFPIWVVVSLLMEPGTHLFGGAGPLSSMLGVVGVARAPFFVSGIPSALLTGLQFWVGAGTPTGVAIGYLVSLVGLAFLVWYVVIGAAQSRAVGYGESAGSCALSCVGLGTHIILLMVVAAVGIFTVVGAAGAR